jgi:hypothetical protein
VAFGIDVDLKRWRNIEGGHNPVYGFGFSIGQRDLVESKAKRRGPAQTPRRSDTCNASVQQRSGRENDAAIYINGPAQTRRHNIAYPVNLRMNP